MQDSVFVEGLKIPASVGIFDWEKTLTQIIYIDCEVELSLSAAGQSNQIGDTLSYAELSELLRLIASEKHYDLLEHMAEVIVTRIFDNFVCELVRLKISKPGAVAEASNVGIKIVRRQTT